MKVPPEHEVKLLARLELVLRGFLSPVVPHGRAVRFCTKALPTKEGNMATKTLAPIFPPEGHNPPPHFGGTAEQRAVNEATHRYFAGEDPRCMNCDCRPWGRWSGWACDAAQPNT